jgi:putative DNA primase/helicase
MYEQSPHTNDLQAEEQQVRLLVEPTAVTGVTGSQKEGPALIEATCLPAVLTAYHRPQWVCWRYVARGEGKKPDKKPVNPKTLGYAGPHWPNTWSTFDTAYTTYLHHCFRDDEEQLNGVGFFLTPQDPFVAVDLDNCIQAQEITPFALKIVQTLQSYTEISPSGTGLRIVVTSPYTGNVKTPDLEIYTQHRYVTLTGHHWAGAPDTIIAVAPSTLAALRPPPKQPEAAPAVQETRLFDGSDQELWGKIFTYDRFGLQHQRRFAGDLSLDRNDHSLTVVRLLNCLARWTSGDADRMRRMILMAPLSNAKWFERRQAGDWLDYQIADAIAFVQGNRRRK